MCVFSTSLCFLSCTGRNRLRFGKACSSGLDGREVFVHPGHFLHLNQRPSRPRENARIQRFIYVTFAAKLAQPRLQSSGNHRCRRIRSSGSSQRTLAMTGQPKRYYFTLLMCLRRLTSIRFELTMAKDSQARVASSLT